MGGRAHDQFFLVTSFRSVEPAATQTLARERPFSLPPSPHTALKVAHAHEPSGLCRLDRHGRPLTEGAIEDETPAAVPSELIEQPIGPQAFLHLGVWNVQGARDDSVLSSLLVFSEVDQGNVRFA
jgi:hypothetical protein